MLVSLSTAVLRTFGGIWVHSVNGSCLQCTVTAVCLPVYSDSCLCVSAVYSDSCLCVCSVQWQLFVCMHFITYVNFPVSVPLLHCTVLCNNFLVKISKTVTRHRTITAGLKGQYCRELLITHRNVFATHCVHYFGCAKWYNAPVYNTRRCTVYKSSQTHNFAFQCMVIVFSKDARFFGCWDGRSANYVYTKYGNITAGARMGERTFVQGLHRNTWEKWTGPFGGRPRIR
jgi:hypothetical protein